MSSTSLTTKVMMLRARHHLHTVWGMDHLDPEAALPTELTAPVRVVLLVIEEGRLDTTQWTSIVKGRRSDDPMKEATKTQWLDVWIEAERLWRAHGESDLPLIAGIDVIFEERDLFSAPMIKLIWREYDGTDLPWREGEVVDDYYFCQKDEDDRFEEAEQEIHGEVEP